MIDINKIIFPEIIDSNLVKLHNRNWYLNTYKRLIIKCINTDYSSIITEKHHILPKCMGGKDKDNIIKVDVRSHIILHMLLSSAYPDNYKLLHAASSMFIMRDSIQINTRAAAISSISARLSTFL